MPALQTHVDVYELCNDSLKESFVDFKPLSVADLPADAAHWNLDEHRISSHLVEHSMPRRDAAAFIRWYAKTCARMGWKILCRF